MADKINPKMNQKTSALGKLQFSFAIISDTHLTEVDGESSSPWPSNKLANGRAIWAFREIERLSPAFILHLGDLVHPVPAQPSFGPAAERYKAVVSKVSRPIHVTPGNHDIGDKPVSWAPAGTIQDSYIDQYESFFGPSYHAFSSNGCRFIILNASLLNSGLARESTQRDWLENELRSLNGQRCFVSIHYPPYVCSPDEPGGYDNIDEPARSWFLGLIARYKPEAMFSGHVHNYWYDVFGDTRFYILPSTSFVRQDYSELYRTGPGRENGRDDAAKLGFAIVDVHENGHVVRVIRSFGSVEESKPLSELATKPVHTRANPPVRLGVDLRHPWAETIEIPANGGVDEFARKHARNDYPLQAIWELGLCNLRVPASDLFNPASRERMRLLQQQGNVFTAFFFGLPSRPDKERLKEFASLLDGIEIVSPWPSDHIKMSDLRNVTNETGLPIFLSKLRKGHASSAPNKYAHSIRHGFTIEELDDAAKEFSGWVDKAGGIVLRVGRETSGWLATMAAAKWARDSGIRARLMVRLAGDDPAGSETDDLANAARVAEASFAAWLSPEVDVFFDTFDDVDRGYFATNGLVDRRYNPRPSGHVIHNLQAVLASFDRSRFRTDKDIKNSTPIARNGRESLGVLLPGMSVQDVLQEGHRDVFAVGLISGERADGKQAVVAEPTLFSTC